MVDGARDGRLVDVELARDRANGLWFACIDAKDQDRHLPEAKIMRLVPNELAQALKKGNCRIIGVQDVDQAFFARVPALVFWISLIRHRPHCPFLVGRSPSAFACFSHSNSPCSVRPNHRSPW